MNILVPKAFPLVLSIALLMSYNGCKNSNPSGPSIPYTTISVPATLEDNIPYSALGSGKIAFARQHGENDGYNGYVIDVGAKKTNLFASYEAQTPSISPDGSLIAYILRSYSGKHLYVRKPDGSNLTRVSEFEWVEDYPSWRYGSIIYVIKAWKDLRCDIYSQRPEDNSPTKIFSVPDSLATINSPISVYDVAYLFSTDLHNSTSIYIYQNNKISVIKLNYDSLNNSPLLVKSPKWSPNGAEIACMILEGSGVCHKVNIIKINPDGSNLKVLAAYDVNTDLNAITFVTDYFSLCWSPDGSKILYNIAESNLNSHIYVMNSDGSQITQVTTLAGVFDRNVSWSN